MSDDPLPDNLRLAELLAEQAVETSYVHTPHIDVDAGIYDVDCSVFLGFLIGAVAERHYEVVAASTTHGRPLARDFYNFFAALPPTIEQGWRRLEFLGDIVPGDVMAWELPVAKTGDTGHCFVVAKPPSSADDESFSVEVYDSTSILQDGPDRAPTAFRFDPCAEFKQVPIAICPDRVVFDRATSTDCFALICNRRVGVARKILPDTGTSGCSASVSMILAARLGGRRVTDIYWQIL